MTILIADDHPLFRKALRTILRSAAANAVIEEAQTLGQALERIDGDMDLALLDLSMPDAQGFEALIALRSKAPTVPIIVVSAYADVETVRQVATLGAAGFIPKTSEPDRIAAAIRAVLGGGHWWPTVSAEVEEPAADDQARLARLSRSETEVLRLMAEGKANKIIAFELGIKESTVKSHVTSLLRKLGVHSRTQAVLVAKRMLSPV